MAIDKEIIQHLFKKTAEHLEQAPDNWPKEKTLRSAVEYVIDNDAIAKKIPGSYREKYIQLVVKLFYRKDI